MPHNKKVKYEQKVRDIEFRDHTSDAGRLRCLPHLHRELELVYFVGGESVAYADSVRSVLRPGDVFLTFPNQIHSYESYTDESYYLFIIKPDIMPDLMEIFTMGIPRSPVIRHADELPRIRQLFELLVSVCGKEKDNDDLSAPLRRGYLLALFSELISHMNIDRPSAGDFGVLRSIVSYCSQHYTENLSLSHLEEKLHLNKYYISHLFSGKLGLRFNDYINSLRIAEARRLLVHSDMSITEISELIGFNTLRTFNRAFFKQMGHSPSEYRKLFPAAKG